MKENNNANIAAIIYSIADMWETKGDKWRPIAYRKAVSKLAKKPIKKGIRADVDNRNESMGKRIRDSQVEWVPYTIVLGDKEIKEGMLPVKNRKLGAVENKTEKEFVKDVAEQMKDYPKETSSLPISLTMRPVF